MGHEDDFAAVAFVTGAAHGIGRASVLRLLADGYRVIAADLDLEGAEHTIAMAAHGQAIALGLDIADEAQTRACIEKSTAAFGRIDVYHLNAGVISSLTPLPDVSLAELDSTLAVNVRGTFIGLQEAIRQFERQGGGGSVIITTSIHGLRASDDLVAYQLSKHALNGLIAAGAMYGAPRGIRVNGVAPGVIPTARSERVREDMVARSRTIPARRAGTAEEIASVVAFLASKDASYMHGQILSVDGGATIVNVIRPSGGAGEWTPRDAAPPA